MRKQLKRFSYLFLALMMVLGIWLPATSVRAAGATTTIKITGIEEGCNVYAYAVVLDAEDAQGNHYWKYNASGTVKNRVEDGSIDADDVIYFYTHLNTGTAEPLWNVHDGGGEAVVDQTVLALTWNAADSSYSVSDVAPGLYVIAANKETHDYSYNGIVVPVNYQYDGNGNASIADTNGVINVVAKKTSDPVLKKEVVVSGDSTAKYSDAMVGDTVDFKISLTMPAYEGAWLSDELHYVINDSLSTGLTLDVDSIKVEGTSLSDLLAGKKSAKTAATTSTSGFTLDLYGEDAYTYKGATIAITYSAMVNEKAKVNFASDENKASIRYTTVAGSADLSDPITDITYHYTFGLDTSVNGNGSAKTTELTKYGVKTTTESNNKVPLAGAQFQIYDSENKLLYFTNAGQYTTDTAAGRNYVESNADGEIVVSGLAAGTYTLKESKAPRGYALDTTVYVFTITPTYNELTGELKNYTVTVHDGASNSITFTHEKLDNGTIHSSDNASNVDSFAIVNTPLVTLPETGGVGILIITLIAVLMMTAFGTMFLLLKYKRK